MYTVSFACSQFLVVSGYLKKYLFLKDGVGSCCFCFQNFKTQCVYYLFRNLEDMFSRKGLSIFRPAAEKTIPMRRSRKSQVSSTKVKR